MQAGTGKYNKGLSFQLPLPASRLLFLPEVLTAVIHTVSEHYLCAASSSSPPCPLMYASMLSSLVCVHVLPDELAPSLFLPDTCPSAHIPSPCILWHMQCPTQSPPKLLRGHALLAYLSLYPNTLSVQLIDALSHAREYPSGLEHVCIQSPCMRISLI